MVAPRSDESAWPVFRVRMPKEPMSDEELVAHLDQIEALCRRRESFALLVDVREAPGMSANHRRLVAARLRALSRREPALLVAIGVVLGSTVQRGVFTALQWLVGHTPPARAFATPEEATSWLRDALGARRFAARTRS